jgi:23S rRNA (adenine2503-C2)-methyltransferase
MDKVNLKALSESELKGYMSGLGLPDYRARQTLHWIYEKRAFSIQDITEFSKHLRDSLAKGAYISNLKIADRHTASDGTEKFLFELEDGLNVESVLIPDERRLTLCISSQVGCAMACGFCLTGRGGLKRNLRAFEIADQVIAAGREALPRTITNIVLMGMGEPLNNLGEVAEALWRITGLMKYSPRRVTVSTCGVADKMLELPKVAPRVNLAVSLNATTDRVRNQIMPINRKYPLEVLLDACRRYPLEKRRRVTFEYVMIDGLNDTAEDARRLIKIARQIPSKINLIPFNESEGFKHKSPSEERVLEFQRILQDGGVTAIIRKSKGSEILAACGQLSAKGGAYSSS